MNTTEANKLIAEFMGDAFMEISMDGDTHHPLFHSSWDWLMPVVEKINTTHAVNIGRISCQISHILDQENPISAIVCGDTSKLHETVYTAVVEFIKWYNENN
jgi:hypothetical protein